MNTWFKFIFGCLWNNTLQHIQARLVHGIRTYWNSSQSFKVAYFINDQMPTLAFDSFACHGFATSFWNETLQVEFINMWKQLNNNSKT